MRRSCDVVVAAVSRSAKPSRHREVALLFALLAGASCRPSPPATEPALAPLAIGPARPLSPPPPAAPEAPAPPPDDLLLLLRVNDADQLARELPTVLPATIAPALSALSPAQIVSMVLPPAYVDAADATQPIDIASLSTNDAFVVSFAAKPDAEGRAGPPSRSAPTFAEGGALKECALVPSTGATSTRLVCAADADALRRASKWLARTVAAEPFDGDVHLTVPGKVMREKTGTPAKKIEDAAGEHFGEEAVNRFLGEIERLDGDVRFSGSDVDASLALSFTSRRSMLTQWVVPRTPPSAPPRLFRRLPSDALFAFATVGATPDDLALLRRSFGDDLASSLVDDGFVPEKVAALRVRLESIVATGGPLVVAAGVGGGLDRSEKALAAFAAAKPGPAAAKAEADARAALVPWVLVGVEDPPDRVIATLREIVRGAEEADRTRNKAAAKWQRKSDASHVDVRIGKLDAALRLPAGTLHLDVIIGPASKPPSQATRAHLFAVPKGTATWLGYGEDAAAVAARLRTAVDDTTDAGTLARSKDAATLERRPALAVATTSMAGLALLRADRRTRADLEQAARASATMSALPGHGAGTLSFFATAETSEGDRRAKLTVRGSAARSAIVEIVQAATH